MITIKSKLAGFVPYTMVFFPNHAVLFELIGNLEAIEMVRFFWTSIELLDLGRVVRHEKTTTICIDLVTTLEFIENGVAKKTRNEIRQAERLGQRVTIAHRSGGLFEEFLALYRGLARWKNVSALDYGRLLRYGPHVDTFIAYLDHQPACGHILLRDSDTGRARLIYSANRRFEDSERVRLQGTLNRFLHWREICAYHEQGFSTYDLGGIQPDRTNGITRFKMSFGGQIVNEHTYLCAGTPWLGRAARGVFETFSRRGRQARALASSSSHRQSPSN